MLLPSSMVVRPVVLQDPPKHPFPHQLPFNNSSRSVSPLDATLTQVLILRHLKSFKINTYTKTGGRAPLPASQFVNSLLPPTILKPDISATVTSPATPLLSIACGHFPSPIGVTSFKPNPLRSVLSRFAILPSTLNLPARSFFGSWFSSSLNFQLSTFNLFPAFSAALRDPVSRAAGRERSRRAPLPIAPSAKSAPPQVLCLPLLHTPPSAKSFPCHSYENTRGGVSILPALGCRSFSSDTRSAAEANYLFPPHLRFSHPGRHRGEPQCLQLACGDAFSYPPNTDHGPRTRHCSLLSFRLSREPHLCYASPCKQLGLAPRKPQRRERSLPAVPPQSLPGWKPFFGEPQRHGSIFRPASWGRAVKRLDNPCPPDKQPHKLNEKP